MSTRAMIALELPDKSVRCSHVHMDGYPSYTGAILLDHYKDEERVQKLLDLGELGMLGDRLDEKDAHCHSPSICFAYHRDAGEPYQEPCIYGTVETMLSQAFKAFGTDYAYLFRDGQWYAAKTYPADGDHAFKPIEEWL